MAGVPRGRVQLQYNQAETSDQGIKRYAHHIPLVEE